MRCLSCHTEIIPEVTWSTFWKPPTKDVACLLCMEKLNEISEPFCPQCHRPDHKGVCKDCQLWEKTHTDVLERNVSVFPYNEFHKDIVARWKYRGDYVLVDIYKETIQRKWSASGFKGMQVIHVPLSEERIQERGFNQAEAIIGLLGERSISPFERTHSEKQSKRGKRDRMYSKNPFQLIEATSKPVVLVDDIYTTGRTIRHMAALLKETGCPSVSSFTIFR
ncbi:ComF family protein [Halobacillus sp. Nhm2S1]|uniref:ComF family protein n=1 Tax=Halobacillus sp. Nhm2S1 TaxID=2866716 RepID=UPI001C72C56A|nr:ComF family protein [Halobacillus sp. Nhm2S1]MBX0357541.1 ComF family protein [Halobacillus sp. Nhm2S1]